MSKALVSDIQPIFREVNEASHIQYFAETPKKPLKAEK